MNKVWIIAKREYKVFFDSLIAYLIIILFLGFTGLFTWLIGPWDVFLNGQANMDAFFKVAYITLFIFIPAITMRMIAEERKTGTIELLLTKSVSDWQVVAGKFLSGIILISITLLLTIPYYLTIVLLGKVDHGAIWCGYLGLLLMSASYLSIGLFASAISNNQIVAFLITVLIGSFFHLIAGFLATGFEGGLGNTFNYLSVSGHMESIARGVIDSKDIVYFLSLTVLGLYATAFILKKRQLSE